MSQETLEGWADEDDTLPETCLSFELRGEWGHFRRVEGNIVKQTYRIIPRTTVAGLVAAVLGLERDSYYEAFGPEVSSIAVEAIEELRTINLPQNTLSTAKEHMTTMPSRGHARISMPDPTKLRQQHNYEVLVEPAYRVDLRLANDELRTRFRDHLRNGTAYYPPSLGLSEHLAEITYLGEFDVTPRERETTEVDSAVLEAVDNVELAPETEIKVERSPAFMAADEDGRTTTAFQSIAYATRTEPILVQNVETHEVDGRRVMFS
ncbi:type I-B CRISPR-associated protein Cas5b [Saliphagus sp. GCM10025334]|uniref:type I-B CRISPR-associated protein Cas5b n=1 Tax=Natronosalvus caseinilyticus TaxID=2953747 RepID=UPI0028AAD0A0|nr:type I-B CRISPR-associated protein Cas5b [Natronosalvus caseinilyticus]